MASRESQGLQIALILFVMIAIGLGIWAFISNNAIAEAKAAKKTAVDQKDSADKRARVLDFQVAYLKHTIGVGDPLPQAEIDALFTSLQREDPDAFKTMSDLRTNYEAHVARASGNTYKDVADYYYTQLQARWKETRDELSTQQQAATTAINQEKAKVNSATNQLTSAQGQRDAALSKATAAEAAADKYKKSTTEVEAAGTARANLLSADINAKKEVITTKDGQIAKLKRDIRTAIERNKELYRKDFDQPDGRVTWVSQRSRTVSINLGLADGLYRQTTFSVYDQSEPNYAAAKPKAKIEVIELENRHQATARIVEDDLSNPILPGDVIYTPAWAAGRTVKFALAGFMDFNNDGKSDRELIRNVIQASGGEVTAEVTDDGQLIGTITQDVRYLVLGDRPTSKSNPEVLKNYGRILKQAESYSIDKIDVNKLLGFMGFKAEVKTQPLGRRGSEGFKPRTPPRGASGAY